MKIFILEKLNSFDNMRVGVFSTRDKAGEAFTSEIEDYHRASDTEEVFETSDGNDYLLTEVEVDNAI